jgi:transposase
VRERLVPIKSLDQSAGQMLLGVRESLIKRRTQLTNSIRGHATEFGLVAARGLDKIEPLLNRIANDDALPTLARDVRRSGPGACRPDREEVDGLPSQ